MSAPTRGQASEGTISTTILVVDDDADLRDLIVMALRDQGFRVAEAADGPSALDAYHAHQPQLVVLDVGLGVMDGIEVCRQLRTFSAVPVIFLTARSEEVDQLVGFAAGGDDYITKPFSPGVLTARIRSVLRRGVAPMQESSILRAGSLSVDVEARSVTVDDTDVPLTRTEFDLLAMLMENPKRVVRREELVERIWGEWYGDDHVIEVPMSRMRSKIRKAGGPRLGVAVRGVGYKLGLE